MRASIHLLRTIPTHWIAQIILLASMSSDALDVNVRSAPYNAAGNNTTNDRPVIQQAIDDVSASGGGIVTLPGGYTYLTGDLTLKSNVTLTIAQGATLQQSQNPSHYAHTPTLGRWRNLPGVNWDGWATQNYPVIYAGVGTKNVKVTGTGTLRKGYTGDDNTSIHCFGIAFFEVDSSEVSNITVTNSTSYAVHLLQCRKSLISNVTVADPLSCCYNSDGVSLLNCQDVRVTGCHMTNRDDGMYVWSSYADPRRSAWWNSDNPQPSRNIEFDNNTMIQQVNGSGFIIFPWGAGAPDPRSVEISNINVHDNYLTGGSGWGAACRLQMAGVTGPSTVTMKDITFARNTYVAGAQGPIDFGDNPVITNFSADFSFRSATTFQNAGFENRGECYWSLRPNSDPASAGASNDAVGQSGSWYGFIDKLDKGNARIFEGLYLTVGNYDFSARVQSSGNDVYLCVRKGTNDSLMAGLICTNTAWQSKRFTFRVASAGNYLLGLERGSATSGWARIDDASIGAGTGTPIGPPVSGPDLTPPTIIGASAVDSTHVSVEFSESVNQQDAERLGIYSVDKGVTVESAALQSDLSTVILTTSRLARDVAYTLTVSAIRDRATPANTIATNSTTVFQYFNGITRIRYFPRAGWGVRMAGGVFEGTSGDKDAGPYTALYTIGVVPVENQWTEVTTLNVSVGGYRYIRYRAPANSFGNVAEIEFYRGTQKVNGALFGTTGSWGNSGNDHTKAFDGNTATYWDYIQADGAYAGMDLASGATEHRSSMRESSCDFGAIGARAMDRCVVISGHVTGVRAVELMTPNGQVVARYSGNGPAVLRAPRSGMFFVKIAGAAPVPLVVR